MPVRFSLFSLVTSLSARLYMFARSWCAFWKQRNETTVDCWHSSTPDHHHRRVFCVSEKRRQRCLPGASSTIDQLMTLGAYRTRMRKYCRCPIITSPFPEKSVGRGRLFCRGGGDPIMGRLFYEADDILMKERHIESVIIFPRADFSRGDILMWHQTCS